MEYLVVILKDTGGNDVDRGVLIDDQPSGRTNNTLMVEQGHHEIRLDDPTGFSPLAQEENVRFSTPDAPVSVVFTAV